jgi:hypothetical protein
MFLIQGKISLAQYFVLMLCSTMGIIGVTAASYFLPYEKSTVGLLMMILTCISLGSSAKIISATTKNTRY